MIGKFFGFAAYLRLLFPRLQPCWNRDETLRRSRLERAAAGQRIRLIAHPPPMNRLPMHAVALVVVDLRDRRIDRYLVEIRATQPRNLGIDIGMNTPCQQRVVGKINARNDMRRAKRDLLGFGEKIVRVAVEHHAAHRPDRNQFFRNDLGRIQNVEAERFGLRLGKNLHPQFPFRISAGLDALPQVAPVIVRVGAGDFYRLVPDQ